MRVWSSLLLAGGLMASATGASADAGESKAEIVRREAMLRPGVLEFDNGDKHFVILPNMGRKFMAKTSAADNQTTESVTPRSVLDVLLNRNVKRQTCSTGYGYCSNIEQCCPSYDECCGYGYCIDSEDTCCPNAPCQAGTDCCGEDHCYPFGDVCCGDESYCDAGNHCYKYPDLSYDVCCTNSDCTAYVTDGVTVTRTTSTTRRATSTSYDYEAYYFTITYSYYSYFWSEIDEERYFVTSTTIRTSTVVTVAATDASDATSSFEHISETLTFATPAAATRLRTLAGSTTTEAVATFGGDSVANGSTSPAITSTPPSTTPSPTSRTTTRSQTTTTVTPSPVGQTNSASSYRQVSDAFVGLWVVVGAAVGILMVVL
ncbi:MAG: hypothetical protein STHCBS139747_005740 [Sporothrix thermara]